MIEDEADPLVSYEEVRVMARDSRHRAVRIWRPAKKVISQGTLVIGHGYLEHGGRYREFAHALAHAGFATVALDLQGHGRSPGRRGYVRHFRDYHHDVATALAQAPATPLFYLGHSLGGLIALDYFTEARAPLAGLIVINPYLDHAPPGPSAWRLRLGRLAGRIAPWLSVGSGLTREMLTHDHDTLDALERDPLMSHKANASWFREVTLAQPRVRAKRQLSMPLLFVYSDQDPIASPDANCRFAEGISAEDKQIVVRTNELHEVLFERARTEMYAHVTAWMSARAHS